MSDPKKVEPKKDDAKKAAPSTAARATVRCTCGNALVDLFVLYRAALGDDATVKQLEAVADAERRKAEEDAKKRGGAAPVVPPPAHKRLHVAKVKADGTLGPVHDGAESPDAYPLVPGGKYECVFVHHPSEAVASAIAASLDAGARDVKLQTPPAVKPDPKVENGFMLEVDCKSQLHHPGAASQYGDRVLYQDMPTRACAETLQQVTLLQRHLGKLRYVIGGEVPGKSGAIEPYEPPTLASAMSGDSATEPLAGVFSAQTMNAVLAFQEDATGAGDADGFAALEKAPGNDWDYVRRVGTTPTERGAAAARVALSKLPSACDGVVEATTAAAIKDAVDKGLVRNGPVLVPLPEELNGINPMWARYDGALRLDAWNELVKAFGAKGVKAGLCAYRSIYNGVGHARQGKATTSNHKTGHAIDLLNANVDMRDGAKMLAKGRVFPFVMEAVPTTTSASGWTMWLPAAHAVAPGPGEAQADIDAALDKARIALADALDKLSTRKTMGQDNAFLHDASVRLAKAARASTGSAFWAGYLRPLVSPWAYAEDDKGGHVLPAQAPNAAAGKSWLDVHKLAHEVDLTQIPNSGEWKSEERTAAAPAANQAAVLANLKNAQQNFPSNEVELAAVSIAAAKLDVAGLEGFLGAAAKVAKGSGKSVKISGFSVTWTPGAGAPSKGVVAKLKDAASGSSLVRVTLDPPPEGCQLEAWKSGADAAADIDKAYEAMLAARPVKKKQGEKPSEKPAPKTIGIAPSIGDGQKVALVDGEVKCTVFAGGAYNSLEWWHVQVPRSTSWMHEMRSIGWRVAGLASEPSAALHGRAGVGYPMSKLVPPPPPPKKPAAAKGKK